MRTLLIALALLAVPLAGCAQDEAPTRDAGDAPPEWRFEDTDGAEHSRNSSAGSPTVLFFMATWCSSCKALTDDMATAHSEHADRIDVYSLTFDPQETDEDLERWKQEYEQPWPHGVDPNSHMARAFGVDSQSSVVVLDGEGYLVKRWGYGQASAEEIDAVLAELGV